MNMGCSNGALPKVIHIDIATTSTTEQCDKEQQQTIIEMERKILLRTPPPSSTRGILKPSSYHRKNSSGSLNSNSAPAIPALMLSPYTNTNTNANANANAYASTPPKLSASTDNHAGADLKAKANVVATPSTVGTNESSLDSEINCKDHDDDIHGITQSPDNSLDRIICNLDSSITNNTNHSPQRPSSVLLSTPAFTTSTNQNEHHEHHYEEEEWLRTRHARIKHIEDLNERIKAAKARKLVERKAYRREDKLLLRLARELKTTSKQVNETAWKIQQLEETNERLQEDTARSQRELHQLKSTVTPTLQQRLLSEHQVMLENDKSKHRFVLRDQSTSLEALNTAHQLRCQELCESVLDANAQVDRLLAALVLLEEKGDNKDKKGTGTGTTSGPRSPRRNTSTRITGSPTRRWRKGSNIISTRTRSKSSSNNSNPKAHWRMLGTVVLFGIVVVGAVLAIAAVTVTIGNGNGATTTRNGNADNGNNFHNNGQIAAMMAEEALVLQPQQPCEVPDQKLDGTTVAAIADDDLLLAAQTLTSGRNINNSNNHNGLVCAKQPVMNSINDKVDGRSVTGKTTTTISIGDPAARTASTATSEGAEATTSSSEKRNRRRPKAKQWVASVVRLVADGTTLGTITHRK